MIKLNPQDSHVKTLKKIYKWTWRTLDLVGDWKTEWHYIKASYQYETRHYHDLEHIYEMVIWLCDNYPDEESLALMLWCAFYHDLVTPSSKYAEEDSACYAVSVFVLNSAYCGTWVVDSIIIQQKARWINRTILATKGHKSDDESIQWFIDADLQRFRCPDNRYADQIRLEYPQHSDEIFNAGRKNILEQYRAREPFFYHSEGADEARDSIDRQLNEPIPLSF